MKDVTVTVGDVTQVFEVPTTVSNEDVFKAVLTTGIKVIGGRPKRP